MNNQERHKRSIVKSVTWRCVVMVFDFIIIFVITRRYDFAFGIMLASNIGSAILYYFHERAWNKIEWGRQSAL